MIFKYPSFYWFSILFNYQQKNIKSYIEIKNVISKNLKTRLRKDINSFSFYINNKKDLIDLFKKDAQEGKYLINTEEYANSFIFKTADETNAMSTQEINSPEFYYVNSITLKNSYFRIEARLRTLLRTEDSKSNDLIISYFQTSNNRRSIDVEIELNQELKELNEAEFKEKFISILCFGVSGTKPSFYFNFSPPVIKQIRTNMINVGELLELDGTSHLVTKKVDGIPKQFYVKKSICYIINNYVLVELETNIPKEYELTGTGEYLILNQQRSIFPFWFESIKKDGKEIVFKTRIESFNYFKKILKETTRVTKYSDFKTKLNHKERLGIIFDSKDFAGPFTDQKEYIKACYRAYTSISVFPTDGIIIVNNNETEPEKIIDYKFKQQNTIDVYTNFSLPEKTDDSLTSLNFGFYMYLKKKDKNTQKETKSYHELFKIRQSNSSNFYYDNNLSMLVYQKNDVFEVYPINFIAELNVTDKEFIPRLDKTSKMFGKTKYYGNNASVIVSSIVLHKYKFNITSRLFSSLIDLSQEELNKYIQEIKENIALKEKAELDLIRYKKKTDFRNQEEDDYDNDDEDNEENNSNIIEPLNANKNWYKEESNISSRSQLNHISNLNKTIGLNLAISPFLNSYRYKTVFSIYCGRGGDMGKFVTQGVKTVVGIDPDKNALEQFTKRHKSYSETKNKTFNLTTIQLALEDKDFMLKVNKKTGLMTYDVIDCQLGIHFSFHKETEDHIISILTTLANKNKNPKTKLLISTNDKDNIIDLFKKRNTDIISFNIDETNTYIISKKTDDKISVFYQASMNESMEEYLMDKKYFITFLEKHGFNLIQTWTFDEIVEKKYIYESLFKNYDRVSTKNFMRSLKDIDIESYDMKELLSIFRYYIFEYKF
ncbi:putative mRNA-capping enzyme large subunit [Yalta virus]|nr:putative mRNA-capping enzyme large subunit [Yalta virus]